MNEVVLLVTLQPSRVRTGVAIVVHALAVAALWWADLDMMYRLALMVAVVVSLIRTRRPPNLPTLRCRADGRLETGREETWSPVEVRPDTVVLAWFVALRYRQPGRKRDEILAIFPDMLAADDFRRLRIWLKWRASEAKPATGNEPA
jgi:toxin CptA